MPKQNRPLVRDGRLQVKKKRTDRSYLRPAGLDASAEEVPLPDDPQMDFAAEAEVAAEAAVAPAPPPATVSMASSATAARPAAASRVPSNVRAIQHQGVRKAREFDLDALARRDTEYALHELRRIAILTALVIVAMVVLTLVLR